MTPENNNSVLSYGRSGAKGDRIGGASETPFPSAELHIKKLRRRGRTNGYLMANELSSNDWKKL